MKLAVDIIEDITKQAMKCRNGVLRVSPKEFQDFVGATNAKLENDKSGEFVKLHTAHGEVRLEVSDLFASATDDPTPGDTPADGPGGRGRAPA